MSASLQNNEGTNRKGYACRQLFNRKGVQRGDSPEINGRGLSIRETRVCSYVAFGILLSLLPSLIFLSPSLCPPKNVFAQPLVTYPVCSSVVYLIRLFILCLFVLYSICIVLCFSLCVNVCIISDVL